MNNRGTLHRIDMRCSSSSSRAHGHWNNKGILHRIDMRFSSRGNGHWNNREV
jgi:hypothetical protein